ncbi:MAG TPA: hypothetical protein VNQ79_29165 [Blastocatellia bacterium]|nr:hypothetical protein [Blastocatellia bacterium]
MAFVIIIVGPKSRYLEAGQRGLDFISDGKRFNLGQGQEREAEELSGRLVMQQILIPVTNFDFERLVRGTNVEGRIGDREFKLLMKQVWTLREFARKVSLQVD